MSRDSNVLVGVHRCLSCSLVSCRRALTAVTLAVNQVTTVSWRNVMSYWRWVCFI